MRATNEVVIIRNDLYETAINTIDITVMELTYLAMLKTKN